MSIDLNTLLSALKKQGLDAEIQEETNQVFCLLKVKEKEFPLFARIYEGGELVQIITFIPCEVKTESVPDLARLLHLFNRELDIPGFGMDEMAGIVFFRTMIPTTSGKIDETMMKNFLQTINLACENFSPAVEVIAMGAAKFDEMLDKAKEAATKAQK